MIGALRSAIQAFAESLLFTERALRKEKKLTTELSDRNDHLEERVLELTTQLEKRGCVDCGGRVLPIDDARAQWMRERMASAVREISAEVSRSWSPVPEIESTNRRAADFLQQVAQRLLCAEIPAEVGR